MAAKPKVYGALWWLWFAATLVFSYFTGFVVGKIIRKVAIALALSQLATTIVALVTMLVTVFAQIKLTQWMETKFFGARAMLWIGLSERKAA